MTSVISSVTSLPFPSSDSVLRTYTPFFHLLTLSHSWPFLVKYSFCHNKRSLLHDQLFSAVLVVVLGVLIMLEVSEYG